MVFIGEGAKFVAMGKTGPDGKYKLDSGSIPGKQGAMPGKNQVYFTTAMDNVPKEPPMIPPAGGVAIEPKESPVPAKYRNPQKPELTFDVPADGTEQADFQLSSK